MFNQFGWNASEDVDTGLLQEVNKATYDSVCSEAEFNSTGKNKGRRPPQRLTNAEQDQLPQRNY